MMTRIINVLFVALIVASCSSIPKDAILKDARTAYAKAKANPATANLEAMYDADKALQKAENAEDADEMKHLAAMAKKSSEMALVVAKRKGAESQRSDLLKQKDKVVLQAREKEISAKELAVQKANQDLEIKERELASKQQLLTAKQAQIQKLQDELSELKAKQTDKGLVVTLGDVLFETGKSTLLSAATQNISKVAMFLNQHPKRNVLIGGHTDNRGSDEYNLGLSQRRADAVRFALIQNNVASNRIQSQGFGESQPVASNSSVSGRQQNRRVEITILNEGIVLP
ncbi:OmpA family protein [Candidatus Halobeggiatoa sp. HSG11]|nr:OmpA family protein [Candidatus Halobeggiatoa sp. HSG11]